MNSAISQNAVTNPTVVNDSVNFNLSNGAMAYQIAGNNVLSIGPYPTADLFVGVGVGSGGYQNTFIGFHAGRNNPASGNFNTFTGFAAGGSNQGSFNSYYGYEAGAASPGSDNTFTGYLAGASNRGSHNVFSGAGAGQSSNGSENTFTGVSAGAGNNTDGNSFYGYASGFSNTVGTGNAFFGLKAGLSNTTATGNSFYGYQAGLTNTTGSLNSFVGANAGFNSITMSGNTTGSQNTYVGTGAGGSGNTTTGSDNIFVGYSAVAGGHPAGGAGSNEGNVSNNIEIGNTGPTYEVGYGTGCASYPCSNQILIGTLGTQTDTYVQGIYNAILPSSTQSKVVCVDSNGKLWGGTEDEDFCELVVCVNCRKQIRDMGDSSSKLFQLRPVTFFYRPPYDDGSHALQYGLIAEEVAKVYPDLVAYDKDGQPYTVKYQYLAPMLLNELQKEHTVVATQQDVIKTQQDQIQTLQKQNGEFQQRLSRLESLIANK